jgi:hypothetical protein
MNYIKAHPFSAVNLGAGSEVCFPHHSIISCVVSTELFASLEVETFLGALHCAFISVE